MPLDYGYRYGLGKRTGQSALQYSRAATEAALEVLLNETAGMYIDFSTGGIAIKDPTTPANKLFGNVSDILSYTSPSAKHVRNASGLLVSGTTLRVDHDTDGYPIGLLIEGLRTNYDHPSIGSTDHTGSDIFGVSTYPTILSDQAGAPDGSSSVTRLTWAGVNARFGTPTANADQHVPDANGNACTSLWMRAVSGTVNDIKLVMRSTSTANAVEVIPTLTAEWQRVSVARSTVAGQGTTGWYLESAGTSAIEVWGYQLENGAFPTSYIATTTAQVTRARDQISLDVSDFSYSQTAGTIVATFIPHTVSEIMRVFWLDDTDETLFDSYLLMSLSASGILSFTANSGGIPQIALSSPGSPLSANQQHSAAAAWQADNNAFCQSGGSVLTDTDGTGPSTIDVLRFGYQRDGNTFFGHLVSLLYVPRRMTNSELQEATA